LAEFFTWTLLFLHIIEDLADQGIKVVDFGCGNSQLQECFADLRRLESRIHITAPTLYGLLLNVLRISTVKATYCAKIFLLRIPLPAMGKEGVGWLHGPPANTQFSQSIKSARVAECQSGRGTSFCVGRNLKPY